MKLAIKTCDCGELYRSGGIRRWHIHVSHPAYPNLVVDELDHTRLERSKAGKHAVYLMDWDGNIQEPMFYEGNDSKEAGVVFRVYAELFTEGENDGALHDSAVS